MSPASYLAQELRAAGKSEYVGGLVYAMSGASNRHNRIVTSLLTRLAQRLRGRVWEAFNSDTKVRLQLPTHVRFYYTDAMVVCHPNEETDSFHDSPAVVFEVLSAATRRVDEGEKRDAYLTLSSLQCYVLVEQHAPALVIYRRGDQGFAREVLEGMDATLQLPEIGIQLPLAEIYERVAFGDAVEDG